MYSTYRRFIRLYQVENFWGDGACPPNCSEWPHFREKIAVVTPELVHYSYLYVQSNCTVHSSKQQRACRDVHDISQRTAATVSMIELYVEFWSFSPRRHYLYSTVVQGGEKLGEQEFYITTCWRPTVLLQLGSTQMTRAVKLHHTILYGCCAPCATNIDIDI